MPGSISFSCETGTHDVRALGGVRLHDVEFFGSQGARLFQDAVVHADFSDVMQQRRNLQFIQLFRCQLHFLRDDAGIFRDAAGVTARVRILFVDGGGKHADRAEEQFAVLFGGFLQALDVLLDIVRPSN